MADFSAKDIQRLRQEAGVGMMDAKSALVEVGGDFDQAFDLLRERGLYQVAKRADREARHGTVGHYIHLQQGRAVAGVLVDFACETDFVAKSDEFVAAANDIAMHASWSKPLWIQRTEIDPGDLEVRRAAFNEEALEEGKPAEIVDKIVEGKVEKFLSANSLYEQTFVNSEKFDGTVGDMVGQLAAKMGENISVRRVERVAVGDQ